MSSPALPIPTPLHLELEDKLEEFRRHPNEIWIMKPHAKARGVGVFLVSRLGQLKKWANNRSSGGGSSGGVCFRDPYVISRYIEDPLLVGGKKFDLRIYVLVTSYRPLKCWLYQLGFARFCVVKYTADFAELDNMFVHLTNVAIQKNADEYNAHHGGKWPLKNLRLWVAQTRGAAAAQKLFDDMKHLIVYSLKAVQNVMINDKHCFECYGYDVLIDSSLKPWLLEINASPSLTTTTESDRQLKTSLINDIFQVVLPPGWPESGKAGTNHCTAQSVGNFDVLYDEAAEQEEEKAKRPIKRSAGAGWR
eukprot:GILI01021578.1.p1 GENE.GILI01021578.1~~GILI01021578.1.p1  ORF type:complete len:350 (+),score=97.71 GILI01021578.1:134-1051(+)